MSIEWENNFHYDGAKTCDVFFVLINHDRKRLAQKLLAYLFVQEYMKEVPKL